MSGPDIIAGDLVELLPEWRLPHLEVHAALPSRHELAPAKRAFVDFLVAHSPPNQSWRADPTLTQT